MAKDKKPKEKKYLVHFNSTYAGPLGAFREGKTYPVSEELARAAEEHKFGRIVNVETAAIKPPRGRGRPRKVTPRALQGDEAQD
jgi:hypothetical protein